MFFARKKRKKAKKEKEKTEKSMLVILDTNIPIDAVKFQKLEFLDGLETEAGVFVPWAVCRELISSARMAEEDKKILESEDFEKYMEWIDSLGKELTPQQVKAREARIEYAEEACSFVQEKINSGKWKTIGTPKLLKPYLDGFSGKIKESSLNRADLEVLACCCIAAFQYPGKKIVLMTLDRDLRNIAEGEFHIRTHKGSRDRSSSLFKH